MKLGIRQIPKLLLISLAIVAAIVLINWANGYGIPGMHNLSYTLAYTVLYTFALYFANALVFRWLDRVFEQARFSAKRILLGFLLSFVVSLFVVFLLRIFEDVIIKGKTFNAFLSKETLANYVFAIVVTFIITLSSYAFYFYKAYQENKVTQHKIIAGAASAQFESLKNQIDPHFLFNSLNVLSSLIEENPEMAQKFTTSLSKVYRYVLEQKDKELVSVSEELSFARTYMNLLKMRFENSLFYELPDAEVDEDFKVVPLSLQLLLENTVKHNVVSEQRPLHIRIFVQDGYLVVQNNLQKKEVLRDREGVGLRNIISRYAILTRRQMHIEEDGQHFTVKLPILTKQIYVMETTYSNSDQAFAKAQKKVEDLKGFYGNLWSFVVISIGLVVLNLLTYPQFLWFIFPVASWGLGVAIHAAQVFNYMPFLGRGWEEKKIKELLDKENNQQWN